MNYNQHRVSSSQSTANRVSFLDIRRHTGSRIAGKMSRSLNTLEVPDWVLSMAALPTRNKPAVFTKAIRVYDMRRSKQQRMTGPRIRGRLVPWIYSQMRKIMRK